MPKSNPRSTYTMCVCLKFHHIFSHFSSGLCFQSNIGKHKSHPTKQVCASHFPPTVGTLRVSPPRELAPHLKPGDTLSTRPKFSFRVEATAITELFRHPPPIHPHRRTHLRLISPWEHKKLSLSLSLDQVTLLSKGKRIYCGCCFFSGMPPPTSTTPNEHRS